MIPLNSQIWWGTLALLVIFSVFSISYNLAKSYEVDALSASVIATVAYLTLLPQAASEAAGWGTLSWESFNSSSVFTGLLTALIATEIYRKIVQKGWTIKMPESVPPAVSRAFTAVIPGAVVLFVFGIISVIFLEFVGTPFKDWIAVTIQRPLLTLGQNPGTLVFLMFISQILWFFGLHGLNIIDPVLKAMYDPALAQNFEAVTVHGTPLTELPNAITRNFIDVYGVHGGSGATLGLIIAIIIFSKRQEYKELAKLSTPMGIFQINEPIIYGLPIVLNPIMFIPFVLTPAICITIAWIFTELIPFAGRIYINVPWTTPAVVSAFLATGGSITATILAAVTLLISVIIYAPFVILANKDVQITEDKEESIKL